MYESVLADDPRDAYALRGVARTLGNLGRDEEVVQACNNTWEAETWNSAAIDSAEYLQRPSRFVAPVASRKCLRGCDYHRDRGQKRGNENAVAPGYYPKSFEDVEAVKKWL